MQRTGKTLIAALALGMAGCVSSDHSTTYEEGTVKVLRLKGMVRWSVDQKHWTAVKKDMVFMSGVLLQTGPKSVVDLSLDEKQFQFSRASIGVSTNQIRAIRMFENTALKVLVLTRIESGKHISKNIQLDLLAGQMLGNAGELSADSKYEIKLPKRRVEVSRGIYMVSSGGVLNVLVGAASSIKANPDGTETRTEVGAHESFDPETGSITRFTPRTDFPGPYNDPVTPSPPRTANSASDSGAPHGSGMGHSLQKFP